MLTHRIKLLAALLAMLPIARSAADVSMYGGILDVFIGLVLVLIFTLILLWPDSRGAEDRIADSLAKGSWADRIDIETMASERRSVD